MKTRYARLTADGQVTGKPAALRSVAISAVTATPTAGLLSVYDSATEAGTIVYSEWVFATVEGHSVSLNVSCDNGIYVGFDGTLANVAVTVAYDPSP